MVNSFHPKAFMSLPLFPENPLWLPISLLTYLRHICLQIFKEKTFIVMKYLANPLETFVV